MKLDNFTYTTPVLTQELDMGDFVAEGEDGIGFCDTLLWLVPEAEDYLKIRMTLSSEKTEGAKPLYLMCWYLNDGKTDFSWGAEEADADNGCFFYETNRLLTELFRGKMGDMVPYEFWVTMEGIEKLPQIADAEVFKA